MMSLKGRGQRAEGVPVVVINIKGWGGSQLKGDTGGFLSLTLWLLDGRLGHVALGTEVLHPTTLALLIHPAAGSCCLCPLLWIPASAKDPFVCAPVASNCAH